MSALTNKTADHELITRIEQFYFKEARLLDERCYKQWFNLVDPTIEYSIPARYVPQPDPEAKETEDFLSIERELDRADGSKGLPLRQDGYMETFARTMRMYKTNAWSESFLCKLFQMVWISRNSDPGTNRPQGSPWVSLQEKE